MYDLSPAEQAAQAVLNRIVFSLENRSGPPTSYTAAVIYKDIQDYLADKMTDPRPATQIAVTIVRRLENNVPQNESGQPTYYTAAEIRKHCRELLPANWQIQSPYSFFQGTSQ